MSQEEFAELNAQINAVAVQDVHLGRVLSALASHLPGYSEAAQAKADADSAAAQASADEQTKAAELPPEAPFAAPVESGQSA